MPPILRLILEQLAWACFILKENDILMIQKSSPQNKIQYLKDLLPGEFGEVCGKIYGLLSEETHMKATALSKYIDFNGHFIKIKGRSGELSKQELSSLLGLLVIYGKVAWEGMLHYGFPKEDEDYYQMWNEHHVYLVKKVSSLLNGEAAVARAE